MRLFTILLALAATVALQAQDTCMDALLIEPGIHTVDTIEGGEIPMPICAANGNGASGARWFKYVSAGYFDVNINSNFVENTGRDTRFHVYKGTCDELVCVGGDDDGGTQFLSNGNFIAEPGTTYYIAWDNRWDSRGFLWQLSEEPYVEPIISFTNQPFTAPVNSICVVDMNGDFLDDIVVVQNSNVHVRYQQSDGSFTAANLPTPPASYMPSWSIAAGDLDRNGYNDLLYGGGSGVAFMLRTDDGAAFTQWSQNQYVFSQRSNFVDINNDGHLDAFVCHDVQPNVYYMNDGEANLTFVQGGLGDTPNGGNYGSIWVDYDNDGDMDLFIAKCRGGQIEPSINQLHRNNGDGTYTEIADQAGLADPIQTWSSAWADFNNDGYLDVLVGASSFANGAHKLMRNNGDGTFTDVTTGSGFDTFTPTSIEWVSHDFNNDGHMDVMGGGHIMFGNSDFTFTRHNTGFNSGPVGDLNNDGFLDVVTGQTVRFNNGNDNNWLKINVVGVVTNINGIGARLTLYGEMGQQIREVRSGDGFRYMSTLNVHFGLGQYQSIDSLVVSWPSGIIDTWYDVLVNGTFLVVEGEGEAPDDPGSGVATQNRRGPELLVYPNPTSDELFIHSTASTHNSVVQIFDLYGKMVKTGVLTQNTLNVSTLPAGFYTLRLTTEAHTIERKFVKL